MNLNGNPKNIPPAAGLPTFTEPELLLYLCHEMRTVLSKVIGFSELMYDARQSNKEKFGCLSQIRGSAREGESLLQEIVELCGADIGCLPSESKPFSLCQEMEETLHLIKTNCQKQRMAFHFTQDPSCPNEIISDPIRIIQIVRNICTALTDTSERGALSLHLSASKKEIGNPLQKLIFIFESTSSNLNVTELTPAESKQQALRNPFLIGQTHSQVSIRITQRIVQTLTGDLKFIRKSNGPGCRIEISLNILSPLPESIKTKVTPSAYINTQTTADLSGCRILVVEDDPDLQSLLALFLKRSRAEVDTALNGELGLEKIKGHHYDVILADMEMPVCDGLKMATAIRNQGISTPIITLTAHAISSVREKCLAAGCNAFLTKPFDAHSLIHVVSQHAHLAQH